MNNLIERLVNAIFRQEGESPTALNPGNLVTAPWITKPVIDANGFWVPVSRAQGVAGAAHVVALYIAEGYNLTGMITRWAPPGDGNDTAAYIAHVKEWANIPNEVDPLYNFIEP